MRTRILLFAALALAACQKAETPEQASMRMAAESDSAKTAITAAVARYTTFLNANQADSMAALFMDGGMMMPPNAKAVTGRDSIRAYLTRDPMPPASHITLMTVEVAANGPIAIERGTYNFTLPAQGHTPAVNSNGKYLVHWHKMNGTWQIAAQMYSDDAPAMPMPMPPAPRH
jgi:uncharacterized protein (TIGR02246 family)